jgi:hypothetical protein
MHSLDDILKHQSQLENERSSFDTLWQEVSERVLPDHGWFTTNERTQGSKNSQNQYDSTAQIAAERHASAIDSLMTPRGSKWHRITASITELNEDDTVRQYFDQVEEIIFRERYSPHADFAGQAHDAYLSGGVFGNAAMFVEDRLGGGLRYRSVPLAELYFSINQWGQVDTIHRKFDMTARAALQRYGEDLPEEIRKCAEKEPFRKFKFLHCVKPNEDRKGQVGQGAMPWLSYELSITGKKMMRQGGYWSWPMPVYRYQVSPGEWYGRGWACQVLPEIKMLNEARKAIIKGAEKVVNPPLLLHDEGGLAVGTNAKGMTPDLRPGGLNYYGVSAEGRPLIQPLVTGARVDIGLEMLTASQAVVNDAALLSLFQILVQAPQMTATEVRARMQEKGQLLAPTVGRAQSEFLGKLIEREIDILARQNLLPPMPDVLIEYQGEYRIEYDSPLNRLQKIEEIEAVDIWLQGLAPLVQLAPEIIDNVEPDELARHRARVLGVPEKILADREVIDAKRQNRAKQAQAAQMAATAPGLATAIKDVAQAGAISRGS